jgi:hypothetical protein
MDERVDGWVDGWVDGCSCHVISVLNQTATLVVQRGFLVLRSQVTSLGKAPGSQEP